MIKNMYISSKEISSCLRTENIGGDDNYDHEEGLNESGHFSTEKSDSYAGKDKILYTKDFK